MPAGRHGVGNAQELIRFFFGNHNYRLRRRVLIAKPFVVDPPPGKPEVRQYLIQLLVSDAIRGHDDSLLCIKSTWWLRSWRNLSIAFRSNRFLIGMRTVTRSWSASRSSPETFLSSTYSCT